jgi:hypothetical protein
LGEVHAGGRFSSPDRAFVHSPLTALLFPGLSWFAPRAGSGTKGTPSYAGIDRLAVAPVRARSPRPRAGVGETKIGIGFDSLTAFVTREQDHARFSKREQPDCPLESRRSHPWMV